jgi:hypothetical protein
MIQTPPFRDYEALERIKNNIVPVDLKNFNQNIALIQKKYPEIGNDLIEIELLSTIIKDLPTDLRENLFNLLTLELLKVSKPIATFNALAETKKALQGLPLESQKLLVEDMITRHKGLSLDRDMYQATKMNLEMLENQG